MVPALIPFFNDAKFVDAIYAMKEIVENCLEGMALWQGGQSPKKTVPGKKWDRKIGPFDFCRKFYSLYIEYLNASRFGQIKVNAVPKGIENVHTEWRPLARRIKNKSPGKNIVLDLDHAMIEFVAELRDKESSCYGTPGGSPINVILSSMKLIDEELSAENLRNPFKPIMYSRILYHYDCKNGCGKEKLLWIAIRHVALPINPYHIEEYTLNDMIDDMDIYVTGFDKCKNIVNGKLY